MNSVFAGRIFLIDIFFGAGISCVAAEVRMIEVGSIVVFEVSGLHAHHTARHTVSSEGNFKSSLLALKERCPPRQKSRVQRLKAKGETLLT